MGLGTLDRAGLLNSESPDLRDLMAPSPVTFLVGFCNSQVCAGRTFTKKGIPVLFRIREGAAHFCPKCQTRVVHFERFTADVIERLKVKKVSKH